MSIVYCSSPRTGSTLLCTLMNQFGAFGSAQEYLSFTDVAPKTYTRFGMGSKDDYNKDVPQATKELIEKSASKHGIVSIKLHYSQYQGMLTKHNFDIFSFLPNPRFFYCTRGDTLKQAISWLKAQQTGQWYHTRRKQNEPRYDFEKLNHIIQRVHEERHSWETFFSANNILPHRVCFESLVKDKADTVKDIISYLGYNFNDDIYHQLQEISKPQTDHLNKDWYQRYVEDSGQYSLNQLSHSDKKPITLKAL